MFLKEDKEKLALISKNIINLLAEKKLTVYEAERVLEITKLSISNTSKVQSLI